jgi:hypothetical protein
MRGIQIRVALKAKRYFLNGLRPSFNPHPAYLLSR